MDLSLLKEGLIVAAALAVSVLAGIRLAIMTERPEGIVVRLSLDPSGLEPQQITLKKGQAAVLELHAAAASFVFFAPALSGHMAVEPGTPARLQIKPDRTGRFEFWCEANSSAGYCRLSGTVVVID